jgi:arsenate reductase (thioredoxin)
MAKAFLGRHTSYRFEVYAGLESQGINPYTVRAMDEIGLSLDVHCSKSLTEYLGMDKAPGPQVRNRLSLL